MLGGTGGVEEMKHRGFREPVIDLVVIGCVASGAKSRAGGEGEVGCGEAVMGGTSGWLGGDGASREV